MSSEWGRIDDDGTVYVRTADGERVIGSWQAGDAEAGLAYYRRHFEDLATEVTLLEKRLDSGVADPAATRAAAVSLRDQLEGASAIGDLDALAARLTGVMTAAEAKIGEQAVVRDQARAEAIAAKEALVAEAEALAASATSWKASGDRLRTIVEEWKTIKGIDRRTDDALWKRFAAARDAFGRRRGQHFAQLDAERSEARAVKEKLIARAEQLSGSTDWKQTGTEMRELMTQWKAAGRAGRDVEDALWTRFRAAQDRFFDARSGTFAERDAEQVENLRRKQEIIEQARALPLSDPKAAQTRLRDLQESFEAIGHVPRDAVRRVDEGMRQAEQRVRDALDAEWKRSAADANPFLAQFRERLAEAEAKLERARNSGDAARIARAEAEVAQRRTLLDG